MVHDLGPEANHVFGTSRYLPCSTEIGQEIFQRIGSQTVAKMLSPVLNLSLEQSSLSNQILHVGRSELESRLAGEHNALDRDKHLIGKAWRGHVGVVDARLPPFY